MRTDHSTQPLIAARDFFAAPHLYKKLHPENGPTVNLGRGYSLPRSCLLIKDFCYFERLWMRYLQHITPAEDYSESAQLLHP